MVFTILTKVAIHICAILPCKMFPTLFEGGYIPADLFNDGAWVANRKYRSSVEGILDSLFCIDRVGRRAISNDFFYSMANDASAGLIGYTFCYIVVVINNLLVMISSKYGCVIPLWQEMYLIVMIIIGYMTITRKRHLYTVRFIKQLRNSW